MVGAGAAAAREHVSAYGRRPAQPTEHGISSFGVFDRMETAVGELSEHHIVIVDQFEVQLLCRVEVHELDGLTAGLAQEAP